jgi:hypothetical protein
MMDWKHVVEVVVASTPFIALSSAGIAQYFGRRLKRFESKIEIENAKILEKFRIGIEADLQDTLRFREKRFDTIRELYGKIGKIQFMMAGQVEFNDAPDLSSLSKAIFEGDASMQNFNELVADFTELYLCNRILFSKETCAIADKLIEAHSILWFFTMMKFAAWHDGKEDLYNRFLEKLDSGKLQELKAKITEAQAKFEEEARKYL